jgi:hypothetical protein
MQKVVGRVWLQVPLAFMGAGQYLAQVDPTAVRH